MHGHCTSSKQCQFKNTRDRPAFKKIKTIPQDAWFRYNLPQKMHEFSSTTLLIFFGLADHFFINHTLK